MHVKGKFFDFIFTREDLDIFEVIERVRQRRSVADMTHLAAEYMPPPKNLLPAEQVMSGTGKKLWWKCSKESCGHEWQVSGDKRVQGAGCPACANMVVMNKNNLAVTHPELAKEYMPPPKNLLPADQVVAGTNKKLWWKCLKEDCGHEWLTSGNSRIRGTGCIACLGRAANKNKNLAVTHPELAKEYMPPPKNLLPADQVVAGTNKKLWWKCSKKDCGHEWQAAGNHRVAGTGCPACANMVVTNKNNLAVTHPDLAKEYMPPPKNQLPANEVMAGTNKKLWWKCSREGCGHEWQAVGSSRAAGTGCPACSNKVATSKNNLAIIRPDLVGEYMPPPKNLLPADQVVAGTNKKLWWKCHKEDCGHEWQASGDCRVRGAGCPACRKKSKNDELV